jgi:ATP-dependent Clp protease adaptor protein ClpS
MATFFRGWQRRNQHQARAATTRTEDQVQQLLRLLPKYRVILHNDEHNGMDYVVYALTRTVPSLSVDEAIQIMLEAHTNGQAQVIICLKELAEHYREGLERHGLTSTIEPA